MTDRELYLECLMFVRDQSAGEWGEEVEEQDTQKLMAFVKRMKEPNT